MSDRKGSLATALQSGRHALSLGAVPQVLEAVLRDPRGCSEIVPCLWSDDPGVANRAAQVLELLSRQKPELLQRFKPELLGLLLEVEEKKLIWSLAAILPRLRLLAAEAPPLAEFLCQCIAQQTSSIVRTCALQGLHDLALQHPSLYPLALDELQLAERSGTPAMRARSRNLLRTMGKVGRLS